MSTVADRALVEDLYPLSPMQQGMMFHTLSEPGSGVYVEQIRLGLDGLDVACFRSAWERMFERHPALRTSIAGTGRKQPAQVVRRQVELPWREHDCRHLATAAERSAWIDAFLAEDGARGFALDEPSLVRLDLIRTGPASHEFIWTLHHIALDGWSGSLVLRDLFLTYYALRRGETLTLPPVRPYREYIEWLHRQDLGRAETYWRGALAGVPGAPVLSGDSGSRSGPVAIEHYARREVLLPQELHEALRRRAGAARVTLNTLLQGAWALALGRASGEDDVVVGTVTSGRPEALTGVESMVGMFVNTLPVRVPLAGDVTVSAWLAGLQARQAEQREYEFSPLWEVQKWSGLPAGQRLFDSLFVFENYPADRATLSGGEGLAIRITPPFDRTGYPLMLLAMPSDGLLLQLTFDSDRYGASAMSRLLGHYRQLLESLAQDAAATLGDLSVLTAAERDRVLRDWNATDKAYPTGLCLHDLVEAQAAATPDGIAVLASDGQLTYAELVQRAHRLAQHLRALGVGRGERVGLCMRRSPEMIVGVLGILQAGAAYVPLDPADPAERLGLLLADADVNVVLTHESTRDVVEAVVAPSARSVGAASPVRPVRTVRIVCCDRDRDALAARPAGGPALVAQPDDLAYVLYTSGSTGRPKGVAMPHAPLVNLMHWQREQSGPGVGVRTLQFAPLGFDVSCQEIFATLGTGGTLCLIDEHLRRDAAALLEVLEAQSVARLFLPFVALQQLAQVGLDRDRVPGSLREVITAGEQLVVGPALVGFFERLPGCRLVNQYGPTECHVVSAHTLSGAPADWRKLPPIGKPIANVRLYVVDDRLRLVPAGLPGELCIGGAAVARGYLGDDARTAAAFVQDPFRDKPGARMYRTGDQARFLDDGSIEYLGRGDGQVKLRGFRVELGEIESVASGIDGLRAVAAVVREDRPGDRRLVLYYVTTSASGPGIAAVRDALRERLPDHMVPVGYLRVDALPLTSTGKLNRRALLGADFAPAELRAAHVAPRGPIEEVLAELWSEVLGVAGPGAHDDFFDLGGHSLTATQLVSRVREALRVELPLRSLFEHPTIAQLAALLDRQRADSHRADSHRAGGKSMNGAAPVKLEARARPGDQPLSFAQQRLWFLDQIGTDAAYNMPWAFRLQGALDGEALERSIQAIVARHESLRTRFLSVDGKPVQRIVPKLHVPLRRVDLSALDAEARGAELARLAQHEAETPFDLAAGPLVRASLVRLQPEEHVLFLSLHHIIFDGWSIGVLNRELLEFYRADLAHETPCVPELAVQYADFVDWQNRWLPGEVLDRQMAYWRTKLGGNLPVLDLPTDRPRPRSQTYRGDGHLLMLPAELMKGLKLLSRRQGVTLAMTVVAAFKTLLSRYTGQDDIIVGSPIANRTQRELENLIGFFVNSLVLRTDLSGDPTFLQLLQRVHATALQAYEHQDLPFERLVDELQPERDPSRNPLFQVVFAMQNATSAPLELPGLSIRPLEAATRATRFDLELHVTEAPDGLAVGFCYNRDLFDASTIRRMGEHFAVLVAGILADPKTPLSRLPLLLESERRTLLEEWNNSARSFPVGPCLHERFEAQVDSKPEAIAVSCEGESLTYGQLEVRANQLAHVLRERGVGPDVLVGLCLDRGLNLVVGILGVLKAGGAYVPLDLVNPSDRIAFILGDSQVPVLVTETSQLEKLPAHAATVVCIDRDHAVIARASKARPAPVAAPGNLAYVIYTSGSTGKPKGVLIEHASAVRLFDATDALYRFNAQDVWTLFHSCAFDFSVWELWGALFHGGRVVVVPYIVSRSPEDFLALLAREQVTVLNQTPSAFRSLIAADKRVGDGAGLALRYVIFGGEALDLQILAPWFQRHGDERPQLINMYGITETTVHVTARRIRADDLVAAPGSVLGRPIPDLQVYILDAHRQLVPIGVPGEMYVGGAGVARGYLRRDELTAQRFVPDPFRSAPNARLYRTGDVARYLPGWDIEYLGRNDDQIKIRGYRIELGEIEAALNSHPWVSGSAVSLLKDEIGEARLVGYVVPDQAGAASEEGELVSQWASLYDTTYAAEAPGQRHDFNIIGWNSSYTHGPIPAEQMHEWVDATVAAITEAAPASVLEIGCGTGLLLFRVAPHARRYLAYDFSQAAIDYVGRHVKADAALAGKVELRRGVANDLHGVEPASFDAVILNSVIQYFPSMAYLLAVIEQAVAATAPGGRVHVGDVRNLRLLDAYHASVQLHQAAGDLPLDQLATRVQQRVTQEEELVVDPAFFLALKEHLPRISRVEISPKRGHAVNELTKFRYQVTLHVEEPGVAEKGAVATGTVANGTTWLDWQAAGGSVDAVIRKLRDERPESLGLRNVPNARTLDDCAAACRLLGGDEGLARESVAGLRSELAARFAGQGQAPQALCDALNDLPYRVALGWAMPSEDGRFDVLFTRGDSAALHDFPEPPLQRKPWELYGNHPLQARMTRQLAPRLRESLERSLPAYMLPSAFVMLESLPLTANGKLDRKALPDPEWFLSQRQGAYVKPQNDTQRDLADIWCALLGIEQVGLEDDFFDLGGHSLLAVQVVSRIRERFGVEVGLSQLFDTPTLEGLAECIDSLAWLGKEHAAPAAGERETGEL